MPAPFALSQAVVNAGQDLARTMLMPTIQSIESGNGALVANNLAVGAITQLGALLVKNCGPKGAAEMLRSIAAACEQQGGN